jgi:hypothetical protein
MDSRPASASAGSGLLVWLDKHAFRIDFQELAPEARQKNRVILQYRDHSGALAAVGAKSLAGAILKAALRLAARPVLTPPPPPPQIPNGSD